MATAVQDYGLCCTVSRDGVTDCTVAAAQMLVIFKGNVLTCNLCICCRHGDIP